MRVTLPRETLLTACETVSRACASTTCPKPILKCGLIEIADGTLTVMATNLEVTLRYSTQLENQLVPLCSAVVSIHRLAALLREFLDESVDLVFDRTGKDLGVKFNGGDFQFPGHNPEEFPPVVDREKVLTKIEVGVAEFARAISLASVAVRLSAAHKSFSFASLLIDPSPGSIAVVGTDGARICAVKISASVDALKTNESLLPKKTAEMLSGVLPEEGTLSVQLSQFHARFEVGPITLWSRLGEGAFPPWRRVITAATKTASATVDTPAREIGRLVRQAGGSTDENRIRIRLDGFGLMTISGTSKEIGAAEVELMTTHRGRAVDLAIDPKFLSDFLRRVSDEDVVITMSDDRHPVMIRSGEGVTYLAQPLTESES